MTNTPQGTGALRQLMQGFIAERLQSKVEKLAPDDPRYEKLQQQYQYANWLEDAARRVSQLQVVTHSLKAVHPDARGTNLFVEPDNLNQHPLIGSHLLDDNFAPDVVGNAAALDVYKFLKLEQDGASLLSLAKAGDAAFKAALSDNPEQADAWCSAFAGITEGGTAPSSHSRAKQLYWLVGEDPTDNDDYHLLAPLHATSLTHRIFTELNECRFGDAFKAARQARRDKKEGQPYYDYPNLAVRKLGGTKPQNISQLNSERGGVNYQLASLPPVWRTQAVRPIYNTDSAIGSYHRRQNVRQALKQLLRLLKTAADNMRVHLLIDEQIDTLLDELILFSAELRSLTPGWSNHPDCRLLDWQRCWLDSGAEFDEEPPTQWTTEVCRSFALWLNQQLKNADLLTADQEHNEWARRMKKRLHELEEELQHD
ncbi:type I-F CRISPR-associated protein Csy1 [Marinobacterium jannaschii]|uniref:type I-F CRISPR-associated protein Csy1 n=1 Tax=Marinobacterium jannaschii TaxID=64970 RepID=UPI00055D37D6|nr:type I-F CRISPR-associated protein Csy1 [Marinobacterium jannaschii]